MKGNKKTVTKKQYLKISEIDKRMHESNITTDNIVFKSSNNMRKSIVENYSTRNLNEPDKSQSEKDSHKQEMLNLYYFYKAFIFYCSNIASIEIDFKGSLEKVYFPIPVYARYLTRKTAKDLIYKAKRSSQQEKLEDFFSKIPLCKKEMIHQRNLARNKYRLKFFTDNWELFSNISFLMVIIINLLLVAYVQHPINDDQSASLDIIYSYDSFTILYNVLSIIQTIFAGLKFIFYLVAYYPVIVSQQKVKPKTISALRQSIRGSISTGHLKVQQQDFGKFTGIIQSRLVFLYTFKDVPNLLHFLYLFVSIFLHFYNPLIYSILLLDLLHRSDVLLNVVKAIYTNAYQLLQTALLLIIIIFLWSIIAFVEFPNEYQHTTDPASPADHELFCNTLFQCFFTTLNNGLRNGGGIGDVLSNPQITDSTFISRYFFDLFFFIIIVILMLNLIFGIILDAFGELRDEREAIQKDVQQQCFICGIDRFEFETKGNGWQTHISVEHNVYSYLYFMLYIIDKEENECTGVEKYVKDTIDEKEIDFFPIDKSLSIKKNNEENEDTVEFKLNSLSINMETLNKNVDKMKSMFENLMQ